MARPDTNHEEKKAQIVEAALKTFAHYGYDGTTNKLIAEEIKQRTGQSFTPALIYHYFPEGKLQLFTTIMQQYEPIQELGRAMLEGTDAPPEIFLRKVARAYINLLKEPTSAALIRILFTEGPRHPEIAQKLVGHIAPMIIFPLGMYMVQQAELGRVKSAAIPALVFEFFGPLLGRKIMTDVLGNAAPFPLPTDEEMIELHVETFLHGLALAQVAPERKE